MLRKEVNIKAKGYDGLSDRGKFEPMSNIDQENLNLQKQIKTMSSSIKILEKGLKAKQACIKKKEKNLSQKFKMLESFTKFDALEDVIRRDYSTLFVKIYI